MRYEGIKQYSLAKENEWWKKEIKRFKELRVLHCSLKIKVNKTIQQRNKVHVNQPINNNTTFGHRGLGQIIYTQKTNKQSEHMLEKKTLSIKHKERERQRTRSRE